MSLQVGEVRFWKMQKRFDPQIRDPRPAQVTYPTLVCPECSRVFLYRYPGNFSFCPSCKIALEVPVYYEADLEIKS